MPSSGDSFVGRQQEMGQLMVSLNDALLGRGRLAMLVGEPGIGKTRTAQEFSSYAEAQGVRVLWGRCYEGQGAPPYWPWVQPISSYVQTCDANLLASTMTSGASDISEIVPEVRDVLPDLTQSPTLEPEQARFRLFNAIENFLKTASQVQPIMIVLDDLHWADHSSLLLLEFMAQELGNSKVLILGTYRDADVSRRHPLSQTLGSLVRSQGFVRLQMRGMSSQEVTQLMHTISDNEAVSSLADVIHGRTAGNPLFINEIVRGLDETGLQEKQFQLTAIPEGVKDAIGRRLSALSEECNVILTRASAVGREFDFDLLAELSKEFSEDQLLGLLDKASSARIIEELPQNIGRYQFSHALIQETLVDELSSTRRARLHARIGETLETMHSANAEAHAAELAYHFGEAEAIVGTEKVVGYNLLAGEQELIVNAHQEALEHFQRGLDLLEEQPMDESKAVLLSGLGRAQAATFERSRIREVMTTLGKALDYFAEVGDVEKAVTIAEYPFYPMIGHHTGNAQLIALALAMVSSETQASGRLLSRYGRVVGTEEGDYEGAMQAFEQAMAIAEDKEDFGLQLQVLAEASNVDMLNQNFSGSLEKSKRAIELANNADDPQSETVARYSNFLSSLSAGDLREMQIQSRELIANAEKLRDRFWLTIAVRTQEDIAHLTGDWEAARSFSDKGLAISPSECRNLCIRILTEYQTGNFENGSSYLKQLLEIVDQIPPGPTLEHSYAAMMIPLTARISGETDMLDAGEKLANTVLSFSPRIGYMDWATRTSLSLLADIRGDSELAQEQYSYLKQHRGTVVLFGMVTVDRMLGILSKTIGNLEQAINHFDGAIAFCRKAGYRPELAWVCYDYADALLQRDLEEDYGKTASLLNESISLARELDMSPLVSLVEVHINILNARNSSYPVGLSEREVEVLRLVAEGKSNREIASELAISINTVANHMRNILSKTNTSNRVAAATFARGYNLTDN